MAFTVATIEDVPFVCEVMSAVDPDDPWDPPRWRHMWGVWESTGFPARTYLIEVGGRRVGVGEWWFHPPEGAESRFGNVRVGLFEDDASLFRKALDRVEADLRELPVDRLAATTRETEHFRPAVLEAAGYAPDRLQRFWELDLAGNRGRLLEMAAASRKRMAGEGVSITTLAEAEGRDPKMLRKMYEVDRQAEQDIPTTVPITPLPFDSWLRDLDAPTLRRDRMWVALEAGDVLGMSWLSYPVERGVVQTDWTCTARRARGRGVARALKLETVMQAIGLGVDRVRTDNDEQNAPILHLNAELGYRSIPGARLWVKDAGQIG